MVDGGFVMIISKLAVSVVHIFTTVVWQHNQGVVDLFMVEYLENFLTNMP